MFKGFVNKRFYIREDIFRSKSATDQNKYFVNFLKSSTRRPTTITATNGQYRLPNQSKDIAKKPGQRKRPLLAKTSKKF